MLILCTAAQYAQPALTASDTDCLFCKDKSERRRGFGGKQVDVDSGWIAGAGGGRAGGTELARGWEPTSPWSKDRPLVPLKNTCEFTLICFCIQCSEM